MVSVQASATVGNFGPGFDVLSLALAGLGDHILLEPVATDAIEVTGPGSDAVPLAWDANVVGPTLDALRNQTGQTSPLSVHIDKPRPGGSGLGSSASSAAGAALAFHGLYPEAGLSANDLLAAAYHGEQLAGGGNPDDAAAVIHGGLALTRAGPDGLSARRIEPPMDLHIAVAVPAVVLETAAMRALIPEKVPRGDAVWNLGAVAALVDACHRKDVAALGAVLDDRIALPHRKTMMPWYDDARAEALGAGAAGACVSGSGPAMFAVTDDPQDAAAAADAMRDAIEDYDVSCDEFVARPTMEVPHAAILS